MPLNTMGWVAEPSPISPLKDLRHELGLGWLGAKRDDELSGLLGGTKVRKLDVLLAQPPFCDAPGWASTGALGSGHLVTLATAADELGRRLHAITFWQDPSPAVRHKLAYTAARAERIDYGHTRVGMALRWPSCVLGGTRRGLPVIKPGASLAEGVVGVALGALELAAQIKAGLLPEPDRVVVAYGSGGTAAGLALGLSAAGLKTRVHAVAAAERWLTSERRLMQLINAGRALMAKAGIGDPIPAPITIDRSALGRGYTHETAESTRWVARLNPALPLEPVYSGKAMAALARCAPQWRGEKVLLWVTPGRDVPVPADDSWQEQLPRRLRRRLDQPVRWRRRRFVLGGAAATGAIMLGVRLTGYPDWPGWDGGVLSEWEAHVLLACVRALLPPAQVDESLARAAVVAIDRYVASLPQWGRLELHAALASVEHGTTPLTLRWSRLTEQPADQAEDYLRTLGDRGGLQRQLYRGVRDLVMLGHYQQPATWPALKYEGPLVKQHKRPTWYDGMAAPSGEAPPGWTPV